MADEKLREDRLRRAAKRRGYTIKKSRVRDLLALDYGKYLVLPAEGGDGVAFTSLDQVEEYLNRGPRR